MGEQRVRHGDRLVRVVDRRVDVHPEDQLAARDVLELLDERAVAVVRGDPLSLEEAERVRSRRRVPAALGARDLAHVGAQLPELHADLGRRAADRRRDLEHGLHQLRVDALRIRPVRDRGHERLDVLNAVPRLGVEQHELLLDAEPVLLARAEPVLEDAWLVLGHVRRVTRTA